MATLPSAQLEKDIVEEVERQRHRYFRLRMHDVVTLADVLKDLPDIDDDSTVDRVMDYCGPSLRDCAWLVAIRYKRLERMLCSNSCNGLELLEEFWIDVLVYLAQHDRWSCIEALLAHDNWRLCWLDIEHHVVKACKDHDAFLTVFDMMWDRCVKLDCRCLVIYVVCTEKIDLDQWDMVVNSKNNTIRQIVLDDLEIIVQLSLLDRQCGSQPLPSGLNGCLIVACEAGLFTARTCTRDQPSLLDVLPHTPMGRAVDFNQPDVVCFLYHAGATSNRELFQLSRHPVLKAKTQPNPGYVPLLPNINGEYPTQDAVDAANNVQGFLTRVASTPRALKTLCLLQVSGHLGWGHGRKSRIEQLDIDNTLKEDLEFKDQKVLLKYPSQE